MRLALFIKDLDLADLNAAPVLASTDPAIVEAVGRLIARHLAGTEAPALPRPPRLRAIRRELEERPKET
jgi:hypothetical protein